MREHPKLLTSTSTDQSSFIARNGSYPPLHCTLYDRRSRAQIEKDQQAVDEFEQLAVQRQNEGQFFKGLYQASKPARKGRDSLSVSGMAENDMTAGQVRGGRG